jgi:hypothetical protein
MHKRHKRSHLSLITRGMAICIFFLLWVHGHFSLTLASQAILTACYQICQSIYLYMSLQPFVGPWQHFQFLNPIHSQYDSLDGGSARRKAAVYTQNKRTQTFMP